MPSPKIIGWSPVRREPGFLKQWLANVTAIKGISEWWFTDDNVDPESSALLKQYEVLKPGDSGHYEAHQWTPDALRRITMIRQSALERFRDSGAQFLFSIDSDVFCNPHTLSSMWSVAAEDGNTIVSEVYWSKWKPDQPWLPQVWDFHHYGYNGSQSVIRLREPGSYQVGGLGGCTLIPDSAAHLCSYLPIPGVNFWGEDRSFCIRSSVRGFRLMADTRFPVFHVNNKEQMAECKKWIDGGCQPRYFAKNWLDQSWENQIRKLLGA